MIPVTHLFLFSVYTYFYKLRISFRFSFELPELLRSFCSEANDRLVFYSSSPCLFPPLMSPRKRTASLSFVSRKKGKKKIVFFFCHSRNKTRLHAFFFISRGSVRRRTDFSRNEPWSKFNGCSSFFFFNIRASTPYVSLRRYDFLFRMKE